MKKIILSGCAAVGLLLACATNAAEGGSVLVPDAATIASSLKTGFEQAGIDLNQDIQVVPEGDNFKVTVPPVRVPQVDGEKETTTALTPEQTFTLVRSGSFHHQAQYNVDISLEQIKALIRTVLPLATVTADSFQSKNAWVPTLNLISNQSLNAQKVRIAYPKAFDMTAASVAVDRLSRVQGEKMDTAFSSDIQGIAITSPSVQITAPSVTQSASWTQSDITGDSNVMVLTAEKGVGDGKMPMILVTPQGADKPALSLSAAIHSEVADDVRLQLTLSDIKAELPVSAQYLPTDMTLDLTVDMDRATVLSLLKKQAEWEALDDTNQDETPKAQELEAALEADVQKLIREGTLTLNALTVKNDTAEMTLSGTVRPKITADNQVEPVAEGKLTIVNLDKISPVPTVNQAICDEFKKAWAEDTTEYARQQIAYACSPHGGLLDGIRPYLNTAERTTDAAGNTTDVLLLRFENGVLTVNGKPVGADTLPMGMPEML